MEDGSKKGSPKKKESTPKKKEATPKKDKKKSSSPEKTPQKEGKTEEKSPKVDEDTSMSVYLAQGIGDMLHGAKEGEESDDDENFLEKGMNFFGEIIDDIKRCS